MSQKKKDEQEVFDFFTDNLAKASQEFQNRVKESKIYSKIQKQLNKYVRIPLPEFGTSKWFKEAGWKKISYGYSKGNLELIPVLDPENTLYVINKIHRVDNETYPLVLFSGHIRTEEEFLMLEKMITI